MSSATAPLRTAGLATGLALAALLVLALRVPASSETLGAGVRMVAQAPGEVHVPGHGPFLTARGLVPGGRAELATLPVRNVTRGVVAVRMRAGAGARDLDRSLHVELRAGKRRLAAGPLATLRRWSRPVRVGRGAQETIRARAWIPAGASDTTGRNVRLDLELDAELVKG